MEKKFEKPELIIINFTSEDIITGSGEESKQGIPEETTGDEVIVPFF